tara:strand:- start:6520 stop:6699 length:180 start_codon:yes stop_codon:yes gene_type:complete
LSGTTCSFLGWAVDQFWSATPAELAAIFAVFSENGAGHQAVPPLDGKQLEKLKEIYPDG